MKTLPFTQIEEAMMPAGTPTFATVIEMLDADANLDVVRQRDLVSGLRRVAKALGRSPKDTFAEPAWLQPRISKVAPAAFGLTTKSWQNAVSDARSALAHIGIVKRRIHHARNLSVAWQALWDEISALRDHNLNAGHGRFIHFLSNLAVDPAEVTQAHSESFLEALTQEEISKKPNVSWRTAVNAWNKAAKKIPGWPMRVLALPQRENLIRLPDSALPPAFLDDLAALMKRLTHLDLLADEGPTRPLAAATTKQRISMLKRFVSELIHSGVPLSDIDSVAAICAPDMAERGLRAMVQRNNNKTGVVIADMAGILLTCARRLALDEQVLGRLSKLVVRLAVPVQRGMTAKNGDRLRVLRDEATLRRLLTLPDKIWAKRGKLEPSDAYLAREDALAISILLVCPLRIKNIASINIERHIQRPGDGRVFLVFPAEEVKNDRPIEFELPSDVRRMLDKHLADRSPHLCPTGTTWLFPRRDGTGSIDPTTLSTRLKKRIHREIGIVMNAHLFRHLAAMLYLDAHPGAYEAVRQMLGHSSVSKTIRMYTGLETHTIFKALGEILATKKGHR
jgi:integrase